VLRQASPELLGKALQDDRVVAASSQDHLRVKKGGGRREEG
jgi:hypothetical protein